MGVRTGVFVIRPEGTLHETVKVKPKLQRRSQGIRNVRTTECPLTKAASGVELA